MDMLNTTMNNLVDVSSTNPSSEKKVITPGFALTNGYNSAQPFFTNLAYPY